MGGRDVADGGTGSEESEGDNVGAGRRTLLCHERRAIAVATDDDGSDEEAGSTEEESIPLSKLPPLPARGDRYRTEPFLGICVVGGLCAIFVWITVSSVPTLPRGWGVVAVSTMSLWAAIAGLCVAYLLLASPGEIRRSRKTCYPMPAEVEQRLIEGRELKGLRNLTAPSGSGRSSYCVRCLVWRPARGSKGGRSHHCNICQRCVVGFDHHCGVFGRCIVQGNMVCFGTLIAMLPVAAATLFLVVTSAVSEEATDAF
eukprot:TRINITY_DN20524_c0_g1_i1.p1 TRINITY_DN20524_c0_g1~~TRINITY_DN20524_c0_g1_i1.p1  ORF type:complete len:270 (-),score=49.24 TRINITY_DN20524_c0_g1_i1:142-912(-)